MKILQNRQWIVAVCVCLCGASSLLAHDVPSFPEVSIDPNGNAIAVWDMERHTTDKVIESSAFSAMAGTWDAPVIISAIGEFSRLPFVELDGSNNAVAIWTTLDSTNDVDALWAAKKPADNAWGAPERLSATDQYVAHYRLTRNSDGNSVVVWEAHIVPTGETRIYAATSTFAGAWTITAISTP